MFFEGEGPVYCNTGTQTSRTASPLFPLIPIQEDEPLDVKLDLSKLEQESTFKLPPTLTFKRSLTDLDDHLQETQNDFDFIYSDRFSSLYATARALKREKKKHYLSDSLPDLNMKSPFNGSAPPVANIKEGASVSRTQRRYHSIADLNNMRNKFTINRHASLEQMSVKRAENKDIQTGIRKRSPVSTSSQTSAAPLSVVGKGTDMDLEGLLRSDSFKTLDSTRSKNYQFQRSKTTGSETKNTGTSTTTFITSGDISHDEKPNIYKLSSDKQLQNTPRQGFDVRNNKALSPSGDSDRMKTPDLSRYVNGHAIQAYNTAPPSANVHHSNTLVHGYDNDVNGNEQFNGHGPHKGDISSVVKDRQIRTVPVILEHKKRKQTPKMVLKYYGSEIAVQSGYTPKLLPDNSKHIRSIISTSQVPSNILGNGERKVSFKVKKSGRYVEKRLAPTLTMSADNMLITSTDERPIALTSKNLAMFEELHDKKIKPLSSKRKDTEVPADPENERVLEWVKARQASVRKIPQIIPLKQTKAIMPTPTATKITANGIPEESAISEQVSSAQASVPIARDE